MSVQLTSFTLEVGITGASLYSEDAVVLTDEAGTALQMEQPGFTDVTEDVLLSRGVEFDYGILGSGYQDRVANIGTMKFRLNNTTTNSVGLLGAYSPDNSNCRSGFAVNGLARLSLTYGGVRYYKWRGVISTITPEAGAYGARYVDVDCEDVMLFYEEYTDVNTQTLQTSQRSDQLYQTITNALRRQPVQQSFSTGSKTLAYGFDTATRNQATARNELNKIAITTMDYFMTNGDVGNGGRVESQTYADRMKTTSSAASLSNTMYMLKVQRAQHEAADSFISVYHPRTIGTSQEILWALTSQPIEIPPNSSSTITANYQDPNQQSTRIAGKDIDTTPTAVTDYNFGSYSDTTGILGDMNTYLTTTITAGATASTIMFTNTHTSRTGYVNLFYLRGTAIRFFEAAERVANVSSPVGNHEIRIDMPYETSPLRAQDVADWAKDLYGSPYTSISSVGFHANVSSTLMGYALQREPGDRVTIAETVTGISGDYYINGCKGHLYGKQMLDMEWVVEKAPNSTAWLLGTAGKSEIGTTTYVRGI